MLTAARACVGRPHVRRPGVAGGCGHLHRPRHNLLGEEIGGSKSLHHQKLAMSRAGLEGAVTQPLMAAVCKEGVEGEARSWIRYSRKRKRQERGSPEVEEEGRVYETGATVTKAGKSGQLGAAVGSPSNLVCSDCGTSRTPLWRRGPSGPKSLCNACGIRYRKANRLSGTFPDTAATAPAASGGDEKNGDSGANPNMSVSLKLTAAAEEARKQGDDRLRPRQRRRQEALWLLLKESRKFELPCGKEAVEAALLLMAMSAGLFVRSH